MSFFIPKGSFIDNLPRIYGLYTGGFVVFILLMAILEQMGVSADTSGSSSNRVMVRNIGMDVLFIFAFLWNFVWSYQVDA